MPVPAHPSLTETEERIGRTVVDAAFTVHKALGPGLLESIYELCFCHELSKRGLAVSRQVAVRVVYDGLVFDEGLRLDVLVEELVVCELKSAELMNPVFYSQLVSQLRFSGKRLGYLINFNVPKIKDGIHRVIL